MYLSCPFCLSGRRVCTTCVPPFPPSEFGCLSQLYHHRPVIVQEGQADQSNRNPIIDLLHQVLHKVSSLLLVPHPSSAYSVSPVSSLPLLLFISTQSPSTFLLLAIVDSQFHFPSRFKPPFFPLPIILIPFPARGCVRHFSSIDFH